MNKINVDNSICYITIDNKPENYLTKPEFIDKDELKKVIENNSCKAILIQGSRRHFSAGADITTIYEMLNNGDLHDELNSGKKLLSELQSYKIPILAAVEGICFGGGLEIVINADIRVASKNSLFAFPETDADLMPGLTGTQVFTKLVGRAKAMEVILSGEIINAHSAKELSIIDYVSEPKKSTEHGENILNKMINNRPLHVINAVIESIRNAETLPLQKAMEEETRLFCELVQKKAASNNNEYN